MLKKKVFISSTYIDLIPHREAVWELLQSFNVEIAGMERFGARSEAPLDVCLKEVRESDFLISIIGMRYGSVEPVSGKSFSVLEYEEAILQKMTILVYLIDESKANIVASHIDFENYQQLRDFKENLKKKHTVDTFTEESDLVRKLNTRLRETLEENLRIKNYRPSELVAKVEHVTMGNVKWLVAIGLRFGSPYEVFVCKLHQFFLPEWVTEGSIVLDNDTGTRYDFRFVDNDGYRMTIEGLSRFNDFNKISKLFNKLLEKEINLKTAVEIITELDFDFGEEEVAVKEAIIRVLSKKHLTS